MDLFRSKEIILSLLDEFVVLQIVEKFEVDVTFHNIVDKIIGY